MANMDGLARLMRSGCTLVLDALDVFDPTMEIACRALQWWSRELVQVNTYLTTADAAGFSLHWDDHDVVIIQLSGEKSWQVRGPSRLVPMYRDAAPNAEPSNEIVWAGTMCQGDVMHIPRGYWHQATRTDHGAGHSLHLTFGIVKRTRVDYLSWLADQARQSEWFRADLHRWGGDGDHTEHDDELAEHLLPHLRACGVDVYLAARERDRAPTRHVATFGVFGPPTEVVCVTDFPPHIERHGDTVEVVAVGKRVTFAGRAETALRTLLSGHPVNIAQTTTATGVNAMVLAETLIREGVCAELTDALRSGCTGLVPTETFSNTS